MQVFQIRTFHEAECLAHKLAQEFPHPENAFLGLFEIMINAIEHGLLGIGEEKQFYLSNGSWDEEIKKRHAQIENQNKFVTVFFERLSHKIVVKIKDEGSGFNWQKFMNDFSPSLTTLNGRGIFIAKTMCFDSLNFRGNGNEVECCVLLNN